MDFRNVLRECAAKLISTADRLVETTINNVSGTETQTVTNSTSPVPVASTSSTASGTTTGPLGLTSTASTSTTGIASGSSVLDEHRRIFGFRPSVGGSQRQRNAARAVSVPARPRQTTFSPKNTWTKVFVCLAKKSRTTVPSAAEKIALSCSGLGEQKIIFHKDGNSAHVHSKIMETFPALDNSGGYDILRSSEGRTKNLMEIPAPPSGYSVAFLRSTLSQAKGYVRPIQQDITLESGGVCQVTQDL